MTDAYPLCQQPILNHLDGGIKPDSLLALLHELDIIKKTRSPASAGKDKTFLFRYDLLQGLFLLVTKIFLPLPRKDLRYGLFFLFNDNGIQVTERQPQLCREQSAPVRLAGTHKTYQEYFHTSAPQGIKEIT